MKSKESNIKIFEVQLFNVLTLDSGEPDFVENSEDNLIIKNAFIISMGWKPDNPWQSFLWSMFKNTFMKTHPEYFKRAEEYYKKHS
jgi:hypothetical protein